MSHHIHLAPSQPVEPRFPLLASQFMLQVARRLIELHRRQTQLRVIVLQSNNLRLHLLRVQVLILLTITKRYQWNYLVWLIIRFCYIRYVPVNHTVWYCLIGEF